ncbi:hypothetical protein K1719_013450 [Acacia pycnantha]|nr:hypothetical protein K1719_013450 [Acacia pycnantha]
MESPQSVVSPFKSSVLSKDIEVNGKEAVMSNVEEDNLIGVLEVYIHQARDIQNICIYHKQDVYAKICLTSNPENTASTKIINGGGRNPVFDENLSLNVRTVESSLKCEIWMLSRVKNYLEDQLLGFALVPLSEVLVKNGGTLEKEFSLSSTDLFHSPAGFVHMSLAYTGASPDVMVVPAEEVAERDSGTCTSLTKDLEKIEFPDPKIAKEDHLMISEYFGIPCEESFTTSSDAAESHSSEEAGVQLVESFSACSVESAQPHKIVDSPKSSVSTNGVSSSTPSVPASSDSPEPEQISGTKEKKAVDLKDGESDSSNGVPNDSFSKPVVTLKIEPEPKLVQQDIVDLFMKSMQESMAKMKLPNLDVESGRTSSGNSTSEQNSSSRVFYGSRAFF